MGLSDAPGSPLKTGLSVLGEYSLSPRGLCLYLDDSALPHSPAPPHLLLQEFFSPSVPAQKRCNIPFPVNIEHAWPPALKAL